MIQILKNSIDLLDRKGPANWRNKINLDKLFMGSFINCILGQLYGNYEKGKSELGIISGTSDYGYAFCGFSTDWREYLTQYQDQNQTPVSSSSEVCIGTTRVPLTDNLKRVILREHLKETLTTLDKALDFIVNETLKP